MTEHIPEALVAFIGGQRVEHDVPHRVICRVVGVSEAWFCKWRRRPDEPTWREVGRAELGEKIVYFFRKSGETYGSPRITLDLWAGGWKVSVDTVAEIMAELGLQGRKLPRRRRSLTWQGKRKAAPDLVHRRFEAVTPDVLWYGDMTEIATGEGKIYLATVIDAFSRRCLGYAMGENHDAALVGASLKMAAAIRGGQVEGTIFHSDRGSEYTSEAYDTLCDRLGVVQSMGRVGSALDNAAAESFNSLIKVEYIHRHQFETRTEARLKIATWITGFYNPCRRHSAAGGVPPQEFERIIIEARDQSAQRRQAA
ncbi:IS3 family transposase [Streptomyces sp. KMM 9044]|uniref:IS3 family transposase n=1 Tax=Streptomyces sp. KMM 9044 TaxID=2744474 RepID=UPI0021509138|nr:IS3 family transposase [Streptomyces sp. KMM 9044]WAX76397.1 IS3 family transposase [Streptomyces sp. KMM 9044]WAX79359.1 IS3 family transposase [Streptomyces sp. KMM 9044]